ncbi:ABC transporter ATP-binding protein [Muribaculum sp. An289]|jgi:ABC-2 type transport system ATP-binding protein|uniref:ATP-binding cassette domain-containing protein n=1 Tax=Candidatus Merdivivens faecigallinarum TaxID=2840871 RepID=A0A9D9IZ01_9BACT|nr:MULTISPECIES: ATP-binding cassette domain-containing protein [unclassified Muribaculum]MBO8481822.1 ATP-binding cassette domain-containing protein [Candidatus Merdivivens faecigallinarum]OUO37395.1 ABC transporter ATP-binding protein [Muribaculum sp. An289]OUO43314.1 ABC transporter ATP-binding protein [Muribaculum sp. An287]
MGIITCKGISKTFGTYKALDDINLDIPEGRIFGLLGPNGAGKTTLIRIINRITIPNSGEIFLQGRHMTDADVEKIGYMPEERGLYRKMKVGDQVLYLARLRGMSHSDAMTELKKWFKRFEIESWWNKKIEELSKGMAQKVQFITTVVHRPKLVIMDEPFSGFDPVNAQLIRDEMLRLNEEGTTIVLSTHNMQSVEELCHGIALINKSHLVESGDINAIRHKYGTDNVEVVYASEENRPIPEGRAYRVISDVEESGLRTAVLERADGVSSGELLSEIIPHANIVSYRELLPRMNDIFIKIVTGRDNAADGGKEDRA